MQEATRRTVWAPSLIPAMVLLGLSTCGASGADCKPLDLRLTQAELQAFIRNYEARTGKVLTAPIAGDEVEVTAPGELAPMRDVTQEVWGGVAAPLWAIMNPTQAWRIFVPIPPKGEPQKTEPPAPDPR